MFNLAVSALPILPHDKTVWSGVIATVVVIAVGVVFGVAVFAVGYRHGRQRSATEHRSDI